MKKYCAEYWINDSEGNSIKRNYKFDAESDERAKEIAKEMERSLWGEEGNSHVEIRSLERIIEIPLY